MWMRSRLRGTSKDWAIVGALALRIVTRTHVLVLDERRVVDRLSVGALASLFAVRV
jgi:hypothetical protein